MQAGLGVTMVTLFRWTASGVAGVGAAFALGWQLAGVAVLFVPFLALAGRIVLQVRVTLCTAQASPQ